MCWFHCWVCVVCCPVFAAVLFCFCFVGSNLFFSLLWFLSLCLCLSVCLFFSFSSESGFFFSWSPLSVCFFCSGYNLHLGRLRGPVQRRRRVWARHQWCRNQVPLWLKQRWHQRAQHQWRKNRSALWGSTLASCGTRPPKPQKSKMRKRMRKKKWKYAHFVVVVVF